MATVLRPRQRDASDPRTERRRPPAPLLALLGLVAVLTTTWALVVPPWQAPDEPAHFSYVQTLGELHRLPGGEGGPVSSALSRSTDVTDQAQVVFDILAKPDWSRVREDDYQAAEPQLSKLDGGGVNEASGYPPLYYAAEAIPYAAARDASIFTQLSLVRITSGLWLLVTVTAAWLLAGELFDRRRLPQLAGAATVGLWPMMTFISASTNPDALLIALWTLALWMGVKVLKRGLTPARGLALGGLVGLALITKISTFVLVPPVLGVLALAAWRARRADAGAGGTGRALLAAGLAVAALALPLGIWTVATAASGRAAYEQAGDISTNAGAGSGFNVRQFGSYLWQFYLPRLSFMTPVNHQATVISGRPAVNLWLGTGAGVFGWVNVWFPKGVYWVVGLAWLLVGVLFAAASARWWRATPGRRERLARLAPAAFLASVALITLAALHYTDYTFFIARQGLFMQGRYLLPLAGVVAAVVGWALLAVPGRGRPIAAGAWIGALLVFQIASLGLVLGRWYA
jgi:4-amino-4-deoxy-L-arabinose transferase-like glycosyltransferase